MISGPAKPSLVPFRALGEGGELVDFPDVGRARSSEELNGAAVDQLRFRSVRAVVAVRGLISFVPVGVPEFFTVTPRPA